MNLFRLDRNLEEAMPLEVSTCGFGDLEVVDATTPHDGGLSAANAKDAPDRIKPAPLDSAKVSDGRLTATLPPASWSTIRLAARP